MTIILHPGDKFTETYSNLTQYLSLKTCKTLEEYGIKPQIRWPNDNLVNNKKISGILSEAVFKGNILKGIVLGIGVNLNAKIEDIKAIPDRIATSLNLETKNDINRDEFMQKLLDNFFNDYDKFLSDGFPSIKAEYIKYLNGLGTEITIQHLKEKLHGRFESVNDDGTIKIITPEGEVNLSIGDIL